MKIENLKFGLDTFGDTQHDDAGNPISAAKQSAMLLIKRFLLMNLALITSVLVNITAMISQFHHPTQFLLELLLAPNT